jgi:hypothetical protein
MLSARGRQARARLASLTAQVSRNPKAVPAEDLAAARRAYITEKLADHITQVVESAPPLTDEQRDRLAVLLRGGSTPERGAA